MIRKDVSLVLSILFVTAATGMVLWTAAPDPLSGPSFDSVGATIWVVVALLLAATCLNQIRHRIVAIPLCLLVLFGGVLCPGMLWSLGPMVRAERCERCCEQLRQIGEALATYERVFHQFPPAISRDENGKPLYGWAIPLASYARFGGRVDGKPLSGVLRMDEPWDSPYNRKTLEEVPAYELKCPGRLGCGWDNCFRSDDCSANYVAIVGPGTIWRKKSAVRRSDLPDGGSRTVAIVEMSNPVSHWAEPFAPTVEAALEYMRSDKGKEIARYHRGEIHVLFANGKVRTLPAQMPDSLWQAILAGDVTPEELDALKPQHRGFWICMILWLLSAAFLFHRMHTSGDATKNKPDEKRECAAAIQTGQHMS
jgi:hypothetical protein